MRDIQQGKTARYAMHLDLIKEKEEAAKKKLEEQKLAEKGWFARFKRWLFQDHKQPTSQPAKRSIVQEVLQTN